DPLEVLRLAYNAFFSRKPFHRTCAVKAVTMASLAENPSRICGLGNRTAVAEHDSVTAHIESCLGNGVDTINALVECERPLCTDRATGSQAHVCHHNVCAGLRHGFRLLGVEHIRRGEEVLLVSKSDHLNLQGISDPSFFQVLAKQAID